MTEEHLIRQGEKETGPPRARRPRLLALDLIRFYWYRIVTARRPQPVRPFQGAPEMTRFRPA